MNSLVPQSQINNQFALKVNHFFAFLTIISLALNPVFYQFTNRIDLDLEFANYQSGKISNVFPNIADFSFVNKQEFFTDQETKIKNEEIAKKDQEQLATNQQASAKDREGIQNASSLLFAKQASLQDDSRQGLRRSLSLTPEPVFAEKRNAFFLRKNPQNFDQNKTLNLQNKVLEQQLVGQFGQGGNAGNKNGGIASFAKSAYSTNAIDPNLNPPSNNPADNITTNSAANIVYEAGEGEHSLNDLILMTSADIINHGSLIADGNINLSAYNIINSKVATTQTNGHGFNTTLSGEALIKAGGNVLLQATNDINNYAGTIIAETGNITLLAGNNVNIGTMQERNFVHVGGKFQYHFDQTINHGSEISAGNNIVIKAGNNSTTQNQDSGNINITGSNLTSGTNNLAAEGSIFLNAANDVNIKSSTDSLVTYGNARKSSFYQASTTNNESNLTAGKNSANGSIYINTFNIDENNQGAISIPANLAAKDNNAPLHSDHLCKNLLVAFS